MTVNPDIDGSAKTLNHKPMLRKTQNKILRTKWIQTYSQVGARILHLR